MVNREAESLIDLDEVLKTYRYVPETGFLYWREKGRKRNMNAPVGGLNTKGYRVILMRQRLYLAHRVIWFMVHGEWPNLIDHINGNKNDNRIENLRSVNQAQNLQNRKISKRNKSGYTGINFNKKRNRYLVSIGKKSVGWFKTLEEAIEARKKVEREYFTHARVLW